MDYKIIFAPALGLKPEFEKLYQNQAEAEIALEAISLYTLMLHENGLMRDYTNFGVVARRDAEDGWVEVDGDGNEI